MEKIQVFLDTDVIISALLSKSGASYSLVTHADINKVISKTVGIEVERVSKRLHITHKETSNLLKEIKTTSLNLTKKEILENYNKFVIDEEDSHIVAGAVKTKTNFLLTHNLRHYHLEKIKSELGIIVLKPGKFLQYTRSISK